MILQKTMTPLLAQCIMVILDPDAAILEALGDMAVMAAVDAAGIAAAAIVDMAGAMAEGLEARFCHI